MLSPALLAAVFAASSCLAWPGRAGRDDGEHGNPRDGPVPVARVQRTPSGMPGLPGPARGRVGSRPGRRLAAALGALGVRGRAGRRHTSWVADFGEVVAVGLDAGLDLSAAALASAESPGVLAAAGWLHPCLVEAVDGGRGVTALLDSAPDLSDDERDDLALLVRAWRLAERAGAAASTVTASAAASIRERRAAADRTRVVVSGPSASMVLLSVLPLTGPAAAALVGLTPDRLYDTAGSRSLALVGLLLTASGWAWARRLIRRASRPGHTQGDAR